MIQFGEWTVNEKLDIHSEKYNLTIESKMLGKNNAIEYLIDEGININDFMQAYLYACKQKKIKSITLNIS
jgi:hypothetical protein